MLSKALYDYLRQECDVVLHAYKGLADQPADPKAVHAIRVATKKLRAFFSLAQQLPGYSFGAGKHLHLVRLLQSIGGAARDTHLQEMHLKRYERKAKTRFSHAHLLLKTRQATAIEMLKAAIKHTTLKKLGTLPERFRQATKDLDNDQAMEALITFLNRQRAQITVPPSNAHHEVWHEERKKVKALYYQLTILSEVLPVSYGGKKLVEEMRKGGELLGDWHDTSVLLHDIRQLVTWLKRERINLPVHTSQLVSLIQTDEKEQLALAARQLRKLVIGQEASPQ
ncbi:CHAD domain-containing protein [Chitinophaga terrae (ex Kim and Jung 2007)]|uniref:CHAD domain-containing protein n=1 Tax=Chitinophaga terrae (ex Kim and Jung 2007) TaxID=408074 RepID=UPI00277F0387|nr:CHAD domain-containing protein [Chitinophaga terrae (ex Kim and Jung 2007)]MDQ0108180.1 CHAD domain-containing protein [Chitinophaga terrae (ex Kim and Jung 2007)]